MHSYDVVRAISLTLLPNFTHRRERGVCNIFWLSTQKHLVFATVAVPAVPEEKEGAEDHAHMM